MILPITALKTGGLCMPCKQRFRESKVNGTAIEKMISHICGFIAATGLLIIMEPHLSTDPAYMTFQIASFFVTGYGLGAGISLLILKSLRS